MTSESTNNDITKLSIRQYHEKLRNKEFTAQDAVDDFFDVIEQKDEEIGAYVRTTKELARAQAAEVDAQIAAGETLSPLAGVPVAIKDNIVVENEPTTAASKILSNYRGGYDAGVIKKLKSAGAIILGKTNMDEFAMGSSTENSATKVTKNPKDTTRVPGGSSGGSAAAVAADMAVAALGSDTGGSIRQPAGFCGVVGLKPTYGAVSRYGLIAMASSLDQIGPLTKSVEDAAILFSEIAGKDERDATSVSPPAGGYGNELINPDFEKIKQLRIGIPAEYYTEGMDKEVEAAVSAVREYYQGQGMHMQEVSLPHTKYALSAYYIIMPAEVSANLARFDGIRYARKNWKLEIGNWKLRDVYFETRGEGFGTEVKRRVMLGTFVLSSGYYDAYYAKAQKVRRLIAQDFENAFKEVDVLLTPVSPTTAFKLGEKTEDPLSMYLSDIYTIPVNLAGVPAISIPVKQENKKTMKQSNNKLPIGFQLIGKHFREADILGLGRLYEEV